VLLALGEEVVCIKAVNFTVLEVLVAFEGLSRWNLMVELWGE
jgi:hypothetical protein